jgi:hypothetical protein
VPPHNKREKTCPDCRGTYWGTGNSRRCGPCAFAWERARNHSSKNKGGRERPRVERNCTVCGVLFEGSHKSLYCLPCGAEVRANSRKSLGELYPPRERLVPPPRQALKVIPPPCRECVYCHPTEQFETGMLCRAEAMIRCQPYRPGAVPLVRKEKV